MFNWTAIPCQFAYRYYLVKYGDRPRHMALFVWILILALIYSFCAFSTFNMYATVDLTFSAHAKVILANAGYNIPIYNVHGGSIVSK